MENQVFDDFIEDANEYRKHPPKKIVALKNLIFHFTLSTIFFGLAIYLAISEKIFFRSDNDETWRSVTFEGIIYIIICLGVCVLLSLKYVTIIYPHEYLEFNIYKMILTEKSIENVDIKKNSKVKLNDVVSVRLVKLTEEEKRYKVYYKHIFNKYLRIVMKNCSTKYVYVGSYSKKQIRK